MSLDNAQWLEAGAECSAPVFRSRLTDVPAFTEAHVDVCGLGFFELYINGRRVTDFVHMPAPSTFEQIGNRRVYYPLSDIFACPRVYYCRFDVTEFLKPGGNLVSVCLGRGWYGQDKRNCEGDFSLGACKLAFCLAVTDEKGAETEYPSRAENTKWLPSEILENNLYYGEKHDLSLFSDYHSPSFDDGKCQSAVPASQVPGGKLTLFDFPFDKTERTVVPKLLRTTENGDRLFDVGEEISGTVRFDTRTSGEVRFVFSSTLNEDVSLCFLHCGGGHGYDGEGQIQRFTLLGDGREHKDVHPRFSWQGFRYFTVSGEAENIRCDFIHTDIAVTSGFTSGDETVNALYKNFIRTELCNLHGCVPSDCPHRERLGYTGDGQITCETVMHVFDAKETYRKWIRDIFDCQNTENGHIQHTAPFFGGGGGPGGWGGAAVIVPYSYYKYYGDPLIVTEYAEGMKAYIEYMESRCEDGLVVREEKGGWCLGDWCFTGCSASGKFPLTEPYVNTCYLVKCLQMCIELSSLGLLSLDLPLYEQRIAFHKAALCEHFHDAESGDFCENFRGANAFALDIGLGDERTFDNLCRMYEELGGLDTGIFATEIMLRLFSRRGRTDLVYKLLSSHKENNSFGYMFDCGGTTLWEDWDGHTSHNHPMFGGCVKELFCGFLGIRNEGIGFDKVKISPCDLPALGSFEGFITVPKGKISVRCDREDENLRFTVTVPENTEAEFVFGSVSEKLPGGKPCVFLCRSAKQ